MMKGDYQPDSSYYVGVLPNGKTYWCCEQDDFFEAYEEMIKEKEFWCRYAPYECTMETS